MEASRPTIVRSADLPSADGSIRIFSEGYGLGVIRAEPEEGGTSIDACRVVNRHCTVEQITPTNHPVANRSDV